MDTGRPHLLLEATPERTPWLSMAKFNETGGVVVWRASDTSGTPPADIAQRFPGLVPEVPRAFEWMVNGRQPLLRSAGPSCGRRRRSSAPDGEERIARLKLGALLIGPILEPGARLRARGAPIRTGYFLQFLRDRAQILPRHPLVGRRAQQIGRVERRDGADGSGAGIVVEPLAAGLHDALAGRQQRLRRGIAERHQHVRIDEFDLPLDERQADLRLLRRRRAVAGRPPRNHVGDIGLAAVEPDRRDHPVQQFAGTSDERQSLDILVASRRFADEHDARLRIAVGKHQPRRGVFQRAAVEILQQRAQRLQRGRGSRRFPCRGDRGLRRRRNFAARNCRCGCRHFPERRRRSFAPGAAVAAMVTLSGSASRSTGASVNAQSTPASR